MFAQASHSCKLLYCDLLYLTPLNLESINGVMSPDDLTTKPTIETILSRLDDFRKSVDARFEKADEKARDFREEVQDRLDSIEKQVVVIRKDQLDMRMDLRELLAQLREHLPALK
jgi:hypothetical protein